MIALSSRAKEAIKTALAMTIAYGIALSMDWDRPYWAGFAVAFISLSTVGQSLNKGAMRMLGTLVAFVVSLTLIALFPQERWWFMVALSAWVGYCTYMNGGSKNQYFWFVAGFASVIICFDGGTHPANAFSTAVLRAQETGLGILVYSLVTILLWPNSTRGELDSAIRQLATTQHALFRSYRKLLGGEGEAKDTHLLRMQEVQQFNQFSQALAAARTDSYDVFEVRRQWRQIQDQSKGILETLERWRESFAEVEDLDLEQLLPTVDSFAEEMDLRFGQLARMLENKPPDRSPEAIDLPWNRDAVGVLSHFQKAALAITRSRLLHLEALTRTQFETLADVKGFGSPNTGPDAAPAPESASVQGFVPDPERVIATLREMASLWLAYLLWIYVEVPGGSGIVMATGSIGMVVAYMPRMPIFVLSKALGIGIAFASFLYIFVMPQLSSFIGLGPMIFCATFIICYLYASPKQGLNRAMGLAMFVMIIGVSNQQTYNFLSIADTATMFALLFAILALTNNLPYQARPEKMLLRQISRFFRSCEYLMTTMRWDVDMTPTPLDRWRQAFHAREVATLPQKMFALSKSVDTKVLPGTTPEQVLMLTTNLQALAYRMQELAEAGVNPQADLLVHELLTDVRAWRVKVQEAFQGFSRNPAAASSDAFRERLTSRLERLDARIEETLNKAVEGELSELDRNHFYRLLGAYRGLSEAAIEYAATAEGIEWSRWRESRF